MSLCVSLGGTHAHTVTSDVLPWYHWNAKLPTPAAVISEIQQALYVNVLAGICSSHHALTGRTLPTAIRLVQPLDAGLSRGSNFIYYKHLEKLMADNVVHTQTSMQWHVMPPCVLQDHPGPCFE